MKQGIKVVESVWVPVNKQDMVTDKKEMKEVSCKCERKLFGEGKNTVKGSQTY